MARTIFRKAARSRRSSSSFFRSAGPRARRQLAAERPRSRRGLSALRRRAGARRTAARLFRASTQLQTPGLMIPRPRPRRPRGSPSRRVGATARNPRGRRSDWGVHWVAEAAFGSRCRVAWLTRAMTTVEAQLEKAQREVEHLRRVNEKQTRQAFAAEAGVRAQTRRCRGGTRSAG